MSGPWSGACPEYRIHGQRSICALTATPDRRTITGVEVEPADGGEPTRIAASLVVDATGQESRTPGLAGRARLPAARADRVDIGLGYATRTYRLRRGRDERQPDDPHAHAGPAAAWLTRFPGRLLVIGDAVCSFNPVYGQGMTVAAAQAMTLRLLIARHALPDARSYFRAIAAAIDVPWDIAVGADLAFPQVPGRRRARVRLVNAYLPRLHAAAAHDDALAAALVRVIGLKDRPQTLLRPDRVLRVLRGNLAPGREPSGEPSTFPAMYP